MKVKIQESKKMIPQANIEPRTLLHLYLLGVDDFSFVATLHGMLAQSPSGTKGDLMVSSAKISYEKQGSHIVIQDAKGSHEKKAIVKRLMVSLGKVLCRDKSAIDISTAA